MKLSLLQKSIHYLYHFFSRMTRTNYDKVTFCTNRSQDLTGNLKNIYLEFKKQKDVQIKVICFNYNRSIIGRVKYLWYSIISIYHLATSRVFIIDDYFLPIYCIESKRDENIVIQVWHAIGHLKRYGLSIEKNRKSRLKHHSNYDWVLANSHADIDALSQSFDITRNQIVVTGAPRLDDLIKVNHLEKKENVYQILYAPTYRDATDEDPAYKYINAFLLEFSKQSFKIPTKLYVSLHPYLKIEKIHNHFSDNIIIFQDTAQSSKLLKEVDCFITDYSSLLLDYSYFEKPIKIYAPDYDQYTREVGFFVDYQSYLNLPISKNAEELVANLNEYSIEEQMSVARLKKENFPFLDGLNSQRSYQFIKKLLKDR